MIEIVFVGLKNSLEFNSLQFATAKINRGLSGSYTTVLHGSEVKKGLTLRS